MRSAYLTAARSLQLGREWAVEGDQRRALEAYEEALALLRLQPPERTRDVLLAHTHLAFYQTLELVGSRGGHADTSAAREAGASTRLARHQVRKPTTTNPA